MNAASIEVTQNYKLSSTEHLENTLKFLLNVLYCMSYCTVCHLAFTVYLTVHV